MKDLIKRIVQAVVDNPEQVAISEVEGKQITVLDVKCQDIDDPSLTVKNARTSMTRKN